MRWIPLILLVACGAAEPRPATHSDFDAIQREEQVIEIATTRILEGAECELQHTTLEDASNASQRICSIASEVSDADADARCRQARQQVASLEMRVGGECGSGTLR